MKYLHVLSACASALWAMHPDKLVMISQLLAYQARGGKYDAATIEAKISDSRARGVAEDDGAISVIPITGVIGHRMNMMSDISGGTSIQGLQQAFQSAMENDDVKAIIFDLDSPGGTVDGVQEFADEVRAAKGQKPIIAQVNAMAASAAYWLASAADEIVITPSGQLGSIGVYTLHEDLSTMLEKEGIKPTLIKAGDNKAGTHPYFALSDDSRAHLQKSVNEAHDDFVSAVAAGRKTTQRNVLDHFGQGLMFGANEGVKRGMADRVDRMQATLARYGARKVSDKRRTAARSARTALQLGRMPSAKDFEAFLREEGASKGLAATIAGRCGEKAQGEPGEASVDVDALKSFIRNRNPQL